jgi:hypothetical protein
MVIKGMDSIWWWRWDGAGSWRGVLSPTLNVWPAVQKLNDEMRPVREGLGDLLLQSAPQHSGIAIFYSVPSALSHQLENGREFIAPLADHQTWVRATYDAGLDFRYLTSRLVKSGALNTQEFKVLLLPFTQAVGPVEARAIRKFAEDGGTVIADVRPGIYDDHCKPVTPGVLDDLFGIQRTGRGKAKKAPLDLNAELGDAPVALKLDEVTVDAEVAPGAAQAMGKAGETPVFFVNAVGKGRAILLNFDIAVTPKKGESFGVTDAVKGFVAALYASAGAQLPTVKAANGGCQDFIEPRVWKNGDATVVGVWNELNIKFFAMDGKVPEARVQDATITLPEERFVYDLREQKAIGKTREIRTRLIAARANFFAALPCEIAGLKLSLSPATPNPGQPLEVNIALDTATPFKGKTAVYVEVLDPNGQPVNWGRRVVMLEDGVGRTSIPIAFNDAPGAWKVKATELFSRKSAEASWEVK